MERTNALGWRPALDGLRAIAVVCVVLFHFNTKPLLPGGSLGVDLFFALSGFLITALLVEEWLSTGGISLRRFYLRRTLRLVPALVVFIVIVSAVQIVFHEESFTRQPAPMNTLWNAVFAMSYGYNWFIAFDGVRSPTFVHLWTLSIEEQFYLLWPAMLVVLLRFGLSLKHIIGVAALLAAASACVPLLVGDESWHRLYYGTDYRVHGLLLGSIAGILFATGLVQRKHVRRWPFLAAVVGAALYVSILMLFVVDDATFLHTVGFPAVGLSCSVIVLACAFVDGGLPMRILGNPVMTYVGRRSYAIYLWHFPFGLWLRHLDAPLQLVIAGSLTLLAAEISYRIVERPALSLRKRFEARRAAAPEPVSVPSAEALPQIAA